MATAWCRRGVTGAVLLLGLVSAGCGGKGEVSGKVTYQDKPVVYGSVMIIASDKKPYYGQIGEDGTYTVSGVPAGEAKVVVSSPDPRQAAGKGGSPSVDPKKWFAIPGQYGDPDKTPLKLTVNSGANKFDIPMK